MRRLYTTLILCFLVSALLGAKEITFSGGTTKMQMQEGFQTISLGGGARITSGSLQLSATQIELSGKDYRYVQCTGNVELHDQQKGLSLKAKDLFYDRQEELILVNGYFELEDTSNALLASAFYLSFALESGQVSLQVQVTLFKDTDSGVMACRSDTLLFDRNRQNLDLKGDANVNWAGDLYEAQRITVDLVTEEIAMDGSIKGVING
ncbi:MAG: hypothetical protein AB7C91_06310 [Sphaerochaeta sp.]|jgi:lipopolysaccharide export system protein LptA|uniref:hypothetical protein n=1 Tax=Sphaerochaeta sp. TaxID=1972642 RepID=UPI002FC9DFB7